mmetsp:Transcript_161/g.333  ORF Transcript_161/g.333 Transcript_161/m.333 type:complete len:254 (-) Transcript_161:739-1500(-)
MVAEKRSVWRVRDGQQCSSSLSSSRKPMSSRRSASSSTSTSTSSSDTLISLRTRSSTRPGVPTTMVGLRRKATACSRRLRPPTASRLSIDGGQYLRSLESMPSICAASSRVGVSTSTRVAGTRRSACSKRSSTGRRKAAVLPLPVCALPHTSRPLSTAGTQRACTSVGAPQPSSMQAFTSARDRCRSVKVSCEPASCTSSRSSSSSSRKKAALARSFSLRRASSRCCSFCLPRFCFCESSPLGFFACFAPSLC